MIFNTLRGKLNAKQRAIPVSRMSEKFISLAHHNLSALSSMAVVAQIGVDACSLLTPPTDVLMCSHTSTTTDMRRQRGMLEWSLTFVSSTCGQLTALFRR